MRALFILLISICALATVSARASGGWRRGNSSGNYTERNWSRSKSLYVRKVDADHPYFVRFKYELTRGKGNSSQNCSQSKELLKDLYESIQNHCNVTNITRVVKNDFLVLTSDCDVAKLRSKDRLEVWSAGSGAPTRAKTAQAFARGARSWARKMRGWRKGDRRKGDRRNGGRRNGGRRNGGRRNKSTEQDFNDAFFPGDDEEIDGIVVPDFDGDGLRDEDY